MPSVTWAIVTLTALVVVAGLGYWRRHHVVTAVSVVALLGDLSVVWAIGAIPVKQALANLYMQYVLWLVGAMTWFALGYAVVALAGRRVAAFASVRLTGSTRRPGRVAPVLGILLVVASAFTTYWQFRDAASLGELGPSGGRARLTEATDRIAALVGSAPSHGNTRLAIETPEPWSMERGMLSTAHGLPAARAGVDAGGDCTRPASAARPRLFATAGRSGPWGDRRSRARWRPIAGGGRLR